MKLGPPMKEFLDLKLQTAKDCKHDDLEEAYIFFHPIFNCSMKRMTYQVVLNHFKKMLLSDVKIFKVYYPYRDKTEFFFEFLRFYRKKYDPAFDIPNITFFPIDLSAFCRDRKLLSSRFGYLREKRELEVKIKKKKIDERRLRKRRLQIAEANRKRRQERIKKEKLQRRLSIRAYLGKPQKTEN